MPGPGDPLTLCRRFRHRQSVPGLARIDWGSPFPIRCTLHPQHHTMVYSMQPSYRARHGRNGYGQAPSEQT